MSQFNFAYEANFLSPEEQSQLQTELQQRFPTPLPQHKRTKRNYGVKGTSYTVVFRGKPVTYTVEDWDGFPLLKELATRINEGHNYCVVQYYPNGRVGIPAHRDKEMAAGTTITGVSLGAERCLELTRYNLQPYRQLLASGSRYDLKPPTNDFYAHAITPAENSGERWSLTYRTAVV